MKGLLLKDFYLIEKYCKSLFIIVFLFMLVSILPGANPFFMFYCCLMGGLISSTLMSLDERSKWNVYFGTLPYTKAQYVSEKYIVSLIFQLAVLVCDAILLGVKMSGNDTFPFGMYMEMLAVLAAFSLFASGSILPLLFALGVEKGRMINMVLIVLASTISIAWTVIKEEYQMQIGMSIWLILLVVVALFLLSWRLSIHLYQKKEVY